MIEPTWVDLPEVLAIHGRQLDEHGGAVGVRDLGLLESALARPRQFVTYGDPDVFDHAAAYMLSELNAAEAADRTQAISIVLALGESADEECRDIAAGWEPLLNCDDFPACRERFQEMTSYPGDWITKVWHWRPMEES